MGLFSKAQVPESCGKAWTSEVTYLGFHDGMKWKHGQSFLPPSNVVHIQLMFETYPLIKAESWQTRGPQIVFQNVFLGFYSILFQVHLITSSLVGSICGAQKAWELLLAITDLWFQQEQEDMVLLGSFGYKDSSDHPSGAQEPPGLHLMMFELGSM